MIRLLTIVCLLSVAPAIQANDSALKKAPKGTANSTNTFEISGMTCDGCAKGVASELRRMPGVISASVTFSNKLAVVAVDTNRVSARTLESAIEEAGYKATRKN